jgi:hypothetical protein
VESAPGFHPIPALRRGDQLMEMRAIVAILACSATLSVATADAQSMPGSLLRLKPNSSLRIESSSLERSEGRLLRAADDTLFLTDQGAETAMPMKDLHVVWERGASTKTGAIVGGVIGGIGLLLLDAGGPALSQDQSGGGEENQPVVAFVLGAAGGALIGALIGTAIPRWHQRYP